MDVDAWKENHGIREDPAVPGPCHGNQDDTMTKEEAKHSHPDLLTDAMMAQIYPEISNHLSISNRNIMNLDVHHIWSADNNIYFL